MRVECCTRPRSGSVVGTREVSGCLRECTQWAHRVGVRVLEWAHGKFQDAYESVQWAHRVGVHMLEWAGSTARKRVVAREWAHGGCAYT